MGNGVPTVYVKKLNSNTSFVFYDGMVNGCTQWASALSTSVPYSSTSAYSNSDIRFYGGTPAQINATGKITYVSGTNGRTEYTFSTNLTQLFYMGMTKWLRKYYSATGYVADVGNTETHQRETCVHELGHALGWCGHSTVSSDVMYAYEAYTYTLTFRDKNHLSQVY